MEVEKAVVGAMVLIIGYFLKNTMSNLDKLREDVINNRSSIGLLEQDAHSNKAYFSEKFETLFREIREMRSDVKNLNK